MPIIFNLVCVTRFGRSPWYFISLIICCFTLSTATLCFSQWFWQRWVPETINNDVLGLAISVDDLSELSYAGALIYNVRVRNNPSSRNAGVVVRDFATDPQRTFTFYHYESLELGPLGHLPDLALVLRCYEMGRASS